MVALVVLVVLVIGGATYYALSSFLNTRFDQQLTATTAQNIGFFDRCIRNATVAPSGRSFQCISGPQTDKEWVLAYNPQTDSVYTFSSDYSSDLRPLELSKSQLRTFADDPGRRFTISQDGQSLRVAAGQTNSDGLVVATGLSTSDVTRTLHRLLAIELLIGGGAVVVAVVATSYGVRFSLRRLRRVTITAQDVATELSPEGAGLDRRVPDDEPETEVGQLATSFNTMLEAVEVQFAARVESENRMRQFLADASHELRTPLTSIRGFAELARMQRAAGTDAEDNLDRIESEGTRMSRLVEDLLILARTDSPDNAQVLHREPVQVQEMLDDVAAGSRAAFPERTIDLNLTQAPLVLGDRDQLVRVVRNLVTNACTHTRPEAPVTLRCFADGPWVAIQVVDGGPGLPAEEAAHVFERFWRADKARSRARGGTGLGMSIVATIVRAHGGTVRFDSSVETGSTVTVWLPAAD